MSKATTAEMDTHLLSEVTSLAMAVIIERTDGVKFRLTTSSEAIKIDVGDGDGEQTYSASEGVSRTNIENDAELNVDNLDIIGVFDNVILKEIELRRGLFDFAEFRIFIFNHQKISDGIVKVFRGQFGEVITTKQDFFQVQVRSIVQVFSKETGEHYSKDCRTDLGDARCLVPVFPTELKRLTPLAVGDFFRIPTDPANNDCSQIILNFEGADGATSGVGFDNIGTNGTQPSLFGDVQIDTAQQPAGGDSTSSCLFDGVGDRLFWEDDADWTLGSKEFTTHMHFRLAGVGAVQCLASHWTETGDQSSWLVRVTAANVLELEVSTDGSTTDITLTGTTVLTVDTDHHAAVVRKGNGDWVLFLDGNIEAGPTTPTGDPFDPSTRLRIGAAEAGTVAATGVLTLTTNPLDTEVFTIDTKSYTFQTTLTDVDGNVLIGATASDSLDNLIAAITLGAGAGTLYAASTTLHPTVTAVAGAGDTLDATAKRLGTRGNIIVTTGTPAGLTAATGVLTLTANAANTETVTIDTKTYTFQTVLTDVNGNVLIGATASDSLDNLIAAITLGAGSGTLYAASTTLHPTVTAAAGAGDTLDATAKKLGTGGNSIVTTETLANGSWGGATLSGGTDHPVSGTWGGATLSGGLNDITQFFNGHIDSFEFMVGFARWESAFTPLTGNLLNTNPVLTWPDFGQRVYEVTVAGTTAHCVARPDTTLLNTHSQGGVTVKAFNSWMREAIVSAVDGTDPRRRFTVTELTPISGQTVNPNSTPNVLGFPDDWFNGGATKFETGTNAGRAVEVRDFVAGASTQDVELITDMPFDIVVGDKLRIFPGCDKTNVTCIAKFNNGINFVGEPYVPGGDIFGQYPDSRGG